MAELVAKKCRSTAGEIIVGHLSRLILAAINVVAHLRPAPLTMARISGAAFDVRDVTDRFASFSDYVRSTQVGPVDVWSQVFASDDTTGGTLYLNATFDRNSPRSPVRYDLRRYIEQFC
jgi:hypothetical protein